MNPRKANNQTQWLQWLLAYIHIKTYQSNISKTIKHTSATFVYNSQLCTNVHIKHNIIQNESTGFR